jgi:type IV pilus assembly protein PilE
MNRSAGFTLIELMIVVGVIGVLAAIAIPQYDSYIRKSKRSEAKVALNTLAQRQEFFYANNGNTYTSKLGSGGLNCHKQGVCSTDGVSTALSSDGNYTLEISGVTANGFELKATAVSASQTKDTSCQIFMLDSRARKSAGSSGITISSGDPNGCW